MRVSRVQDPVTGRVIAIKEVLEAVGGGTGKPAPEGWEERPAAPVDVPRAPNGRRRVPAPSGAKCRECDGWGGSYRYERYNRQDLAYKVCPSCGGTGLVRKGGRR